MVKKKSEDKETKSSPKKTKTVKSIPKGEINIETKPGEGVKVFVSIPLN